MGSIFPNLRCVFKAQGSILPFFLPTALLPHTFHSSHKLDRECAAAAPLFSSTSSLAMSAPTCVHLPSSFVNVIDAFVQPETQTKQGASSHRICWRASVFCVLILYQGGKPVCAAGRCIDEYPLIVLESPFIRLSHLIRAGVFAVGKARALPQQPVPSPPSLQPLPPLLLIPLARPPASPLLFSEACC